VPDVNINYIFTSLNNIPGKENRMQACCSISADYCVLLVRQLACRHVAVSVLIIVYCW
jgi:hypothetical protein